MPVNVKSSAAAPRKQRFVHLTGCKTYFTNGVKYTKGTAYPVTDEQLEQYVRHRCEGKAMFEEYVPRAKPSRVSHTDDTPVVELPGNLPKLVDAPIPDEKQTVGRIDIGDESELDLPADDVDDQLETL